MIPVVLELTSGICNSKCLWCFLQHETGSQVEKGFMSVDSVRKFVSINNNTPLLLTPYSHGEALIHKDFNTIIDILNTNGNRFNSIHTNFSMKLTNEHFISLALFDNIIINIGGITDEVHYMNMGTNLPIVIDNLYKLLLVTCNKKTRITIKMVVNKNNIYQLGGYDNFVKGISQVLVPETHPLYFTSSDWSDSDKKLFVKNNLSDEKGNIISGVQCRDNVVITSDGGVAVSSKFVGASCNRVEYTIRFNGGVQLCCRSRKPEGFVGNAFDSPFADILSSKTFADALEKMRRKEYITYCRYCS